MFISQHSLQGELRKSCDINHHKLSTGKNAGGGGGGGKAGGGEGFYHVLNLPCFFTRLSSY